MSSKTEKTTVDDGKTPINMFVTPLLTDYYEIMMAYSYWKCETHESRAVFEIFFRQNPFRGEYVVKTSFIYYTSTHTLQSIGTRYLRDFRRR
jgi:nicotinic acid phosphoribosyltransferase